MPSYKKYSVDEYTAFLKQPFSKNFGMSEEQVADWFMNEAGSYQIRKSYGVTKANLLSTYIPRLKQAFDGGYFVFLAIAAGEGGGAGNWINHFSSDTSVGGLNCMNDDIAYIQGLSKANEPAMEAPEVAGRYVEDVAGTTQRVYDIVPNKSIGAYFIPSTMAGNSWSFGEKWSLAHQGPRPPAVYFGNPYDKIIDVIKEAGADPFDGTGTTPNPSDPKPPIKKCTQTERIQIFDAETDKLLKEVFVDSKETRYDLKDKYTDLKGIESSGFDICIDFEYTKPFYVKFHRVMEDCSEGDLNLQQIFFPHSYSRENKGVDYCSDFCGVSIVLGKGKSQRYYKGELLGGVSWTLKPNNVPSCTIKIPSFYQHEFEYHDDIKIIINDKMFDGIIIDIDASEDNQTSNVKIDHKIAEWEYRQIPNNYFVSEISPYELMKQSPFVYSAEWYIDSNVNDYQEKIWDYNFPKMSHLSALNKAVELTWYNWWRVGTRYERYLEIGEFGEKKNYVFSKYGNSKYHIPILSDVKITQSAANVYNVATVFNDKSDDSVDGLSLKWAYLEQQKLGYPIEEGFPIVILDPVKKDKETWQNISNIAADTTLEFAVLNEKSIIEEHGVLIEKAVSISDISQYFVYKGDDTVPEEIQKSASIQAYKRIISSMKQKGKRLSINQFKVGKLPCNINVMDKVWFDHNNVICIEEDCRSKSNWTSRKSGWFYITQIDTTFDQNLVETNTITLSKEVYKDGDFYTNNK
ncbi:hypothetical protein BG262_02890 [Floricoccus penangensis]|uniref:PlyCA N-terminal domain-containing protein n=1 Tax=Floricoccus penangensis TaxID=1859475 RepID=A0A9Q5P0B7_9LACT|nr:hypothetical protein [Floricoccus penangensis]OFI46761.1 hypothetical protein BG262_02890 [Floricoccus penangensis]